MESSEWTTASADANKAPPFEQAGLFVVLMGTVSFLNFLRRGGFVLIFVVSWQNRDRFVRGGSAKNCVGERR